jgi:hypothetical protein|tara:strand:- start:550 stop:1101 length:552 start_codon:yes stop_codon:yes gene_type:complete
MNETIKRDALAILDQVIKILKVKEEKDSLEIKDLSNHTIHNASVFQDECSVSLAVVIYALSKIIERDPKLLNYNKILKIVKKSRKSLVDDEMHNFRLSIRKLFSEISTIDQKLKLYMQKVINEAQVKKGCKLCEHGLSAGRASEVMGVSQWELMGYLGNTKLDENTMGFDVRTRIKFTRSLFS